MFGKRSGTSEARAPAPAARPAAPARCAGIAAGRGAEAGRQRAMETGRTPFPSDGLGAPLVSAPTADPRALGDQYHAGLGRFAPLRNLLRDQGHHLRRADRGDRSGAARAARRRLRARGNPRHRQRDHRDQEYRDVDLRAGRTARRYLQRRARFRSARAAALARRHRRHHGERLRHGLHRSQRQDSEDRHPLPRQPAAAQYLPAHRQPDRPPRRRILADLRRALAGRLARQRHRAAAGDRRPGAHHPQIQEGQADARSAGQVRHHHRAGRRNPAHHRPHAGSTRWCPAAPARARPRCSTA